jgi:hypothetical protein
MVILLLTAGHETTANLIGNSVLALLREPEQMRRLRDNPALMLTAVEELLRHSGPVDTTTHRFARETLELAGTTIPQGARVLAGPAPRPLAAIMLEHDARTDEFHATGTLGPETFNAFFRKYEFRLGLEHGGRAANDNSGNCRVTELDNYCRKQVQC